MTIRLGPVIASREFLHRSKNGNMKIVATLGKPRKVSRDEWSCPYRIRGLDDDKVREAYGIDAFQALMMALEGIRTTLENSNTRLSWDGGGPGETGFPRFVPLFYGRNFYQKLEGIIDREVQRFAKVVEPKLDKKVHHSPSRTTEIRLKKRNGPPIKGKK